MWGGFEDALSELQQAIYAPPDRWCKGSTVLDTGSKLPLRDDLETLQKAVVRMFAEMNAAFTREFELGFKTTEKSAASSLGSTLFLP